MVFIILFLYSKYTYLNEYTERFNYISCNYIVFFRNYYISIYNNYITC